MPAFPGMIRTMSAVPRVHLADPAQNAQEIASLLRTADSRGADLCVFPELCLCGYTCGDLLLQPALLDGCLAALKSLLELPVRTAFVVGLPLEMAGRLYNCAAVIAGGRILGIVPKEHLPNHAEFYERRWFEPGHSAPSHVELLHQDVSVGEDLCFDCGAFSLGVEICEDLWVPAPPSARLCMGGALLIANPSAGNELVTKHRYRCELIAQQSARLPVRLYLCGRRVRRIDNGHGLLRLCGGIRKRPGIERKHAVCPRILLCPFRHRRRPPALQTPPEPQLL